MSENSEINRRAMLVRLGLTATAIYTVPAITTLSAAHASSPSADDTSSPSEDDTSGPSDDDTDDTSAGATGDGSCGAGVVGAVCN